MLRTLEGYDAVCLRGVPIMRAAQGDLNIRQLVRLWAEIGAAPWDSHWLEKISRLQPLLMRCEDIQIVAGSGGEHLYERHSWHSFDSYAKAALTHPFHNNKYQPVRGLISDAYYYACTVGDAELRLLLARTSEAAVFQWQTDGYTPPTAYPLPERNTERRISDVAAESFTLARLFDALGLETFFVHVPGGLTEHSKGDVLEHILYLLLDDVSPQQRFQELLACCLSHCLSWMALERVLRRG